MAEKTPRCPICDEPMVKRKGKFSDFWGCSKYPVCKGTRNIEKPKEETEEVKEIPSFNRIADIATKDDIERVLSALRKIFEKLDKDYTKLEELIKELKNKNF